MSEIKNAVITHAKITYGDRGFLDCSVTLDYGGSSQCFGGYVLYLPKSFSNHKLESGAGHFIFRVMEIAGVEDWSRVVGRTIRARGTWGGIEAIGHIINDDWFSPKIDFKDCK